MDGPITIPAYGPLLPIDPNPKNFFKRTTVCWGPSETGKSTIGLWILGLLKPYVANFIVICPTDRQNNGYRGVVPDRCIYGDVDSKFLRKIYQRQEEATETYNRANRMETLAHLFERIATIDAQTFVRRINGRADEKCREVERDYNLNAIQKQEQSKKIRDTAQSATRRKYKEVIRTNRENLMRNAKRLDEEEQFALRWFDFNPSLCIIFDDVQSKIAKWIEDPIVLDLFTQFRHVNGMAILALQADSGKSTLTPAMRQGVFNHIFTSGECANHFFKNESNSFDKDTRRTAERVTSYLYRPSADGTRTYRCFVYSRLDTVSKFRYVVACPPPNLEVGCPALWKLCDSIPKDPNKKKESSQFTSSFQ